MELQVRARKRHPSQPSPGGSRKAEQLVKERRQLKKQWRTPSEEKKEGINLLLAEIKNWLSALRRIENLRRRRRKKEQTRSSIFKDPFKFVKALSQWRKVANSQH